MDGRLKASRQRFTDLDKELGALRSSKEQFESVRCHVTYVFHLFNLISFLVSVLLMQSSKTYSKEVDKLKLDIYKLK